MQPRPFCYSVQLFTYEISHLSGKTFNVFFFGYSSSLCGPFATPSDNHTISFPFLGPPLLLDAGETDWLDENTPILMSPFSASLVFFQIKSASQVSYHSTGQKLCSVLPLDSHTELLNGFFQLHFFANLIEIFTSYYFRTYRVRVTITSFFIPVCV